MTRCQICHRMTDTPCSTALEAKYCDKGKAAQREVESIQATLDRLQPVIERARNVLHQGDTETAERLCRYITSELERVILQ